MQLSTEATQHATNVIELPDYITPELAQKIIELDELEDVVQSIEDVQEWRKAHDHYHDLASELEWELGLDPDTMCGIPDIYTTAGHPSHRVLKEGEYLTTLDHRKAGQIRGSAYPFDPTGKAHQYHNAEDKRWYELLQQRASK